MSKMVSTEIMVISPIDATCDGPMVPKGRRDWQPVHLRQESMDGACGLYSLMMGLIICGAVNYDDARSIMILSNTRIKKLLDYLGESDPLFKLGMNMDDMYTAVREYCQKQIDCQGFKGKGQYLLNIIEPYILDNYPVLLLIDIEGLGHWVLVVGCEYKKRRGQEGKLCRLLVLNPDEETPTMCSWNGAIDVRNQRGKYPYRWWATDQKVQLAYALAIWPAKKEV